MGFFTKFWIAWAAVGLIMEGIALVRRLPGDTLSEQVWATRGSGFYSLLIAFLLWMAWHFVFEGKV